MSAILPSRLRSRIVVIVAILGLAACSDNVAGTVSPSVSPTPVSSAAPASPASLALTQLTVPSVGSTGSFTLALSAKSSSGSAISGAINPPILLSTTDSADLTLLQTSVSSLPANILVDFDGKALPTGTSISASAGTITPQTITVASASSATTQGTFSALALNAQDVTSLVCGVAGSFSIEVAAYDANRNLITSTYPLPVNLTTNDTSSFSFSPNTGGSGSSQTLTSGSTPAVVLYAGTITNPFTGGPEIEPLNGVTITASAQGTLAGQPITYTSPPYTFDTTAGAQCLI